MLCRDNKDVIEEFLKRTEKALEENSTEDQLNKLQKRLIIFHIRERSSWIII